MDNQNKYLGIYHALIDQLDKLARHNRQGSYQTRDRYYNAMKHFCRYLAREYRIQKLANISGKHLVGYVLYLQASGKSASTVKTELSAIRFFHDKMSNPKYRLPANRELGVELERRRFGGVDRTWSDVEFNRMLDRALAEERYDYILAFYLARYAGLRLHECFRIDTATAEKALRENAITVKGKGDKAYTYWEARYTVGFDPGTGKQRQRSITGKTQKEVREKLRQVTAELDLGIYQEPSKLTVDEWLDIWTGEYLGGVKPRTAALYKSTVAVYLKPLAL